jgi:carbamoyl-phosphate synthase large subunit
MVVPTINRELAILARCRGEFAKRDVAIAVSDPQFVDMTLDKRATMDWFRQRGLQTPRTINSRADAKFPIVAMPSSGSGSDAVSLVTNAAQFSALLLDDPQLIFTEYLSPTEFQEYTVDMYYSEQKTLKFVRPRPEGASDAGSQALPPIALARLQQRFEKIPGPRGCITMELCVNRKTGAAYGIDIKARFDEGHLHASGPNIARHLIQEYLLDKGQDSTRRHAA